jgi:hypothetical protein
VLCDDNVSRGPLQRRTVSFGALAR